MLRHAPPAGSAWNTQADPDSPPRSRLVGAAITPTHRPLARPTESSVFLGFSAHQPTVAQAVETRQHSARFQRPFPPFPSRQRLGNGFSTMQETVGNDVAASTYSGNRAPTVSTVSIEAETMETVVENSWGPIINPYHFTHLRSVSFGRFGTHHTHGYSFPPPPHPPPLRGGWEGRGGEYPSGGGWLPMRPARRSEQATSKKYPKRPDQREGL